MFFSHFRSLSHKNYLLLRRNWLGLCLEIVISILCIIALVIFRQIYPKVLRVEQSYLVFNQTTLYPSLTIPNIDDLYNMTKNMSIKYNFNFPTTDRKNI